MIEAWKRFRQDKVALAGMVIILAVSLAAVFAPLLAPHDPYQQYFEGLTIEGAPRPPDMEFWLGTDLLGRDLFSRLLYGARTSLIIGIVANAVAVVIGTTLGTIAGYVGGWIGNAIMRFTDLMMAFPALLLAIALAAILRPSLWIVALVIALVNWVQTARVIYTQTRSLVERDFIEATRALGARCRASYLSISCRTWFRTSWSGQRSASRSRSCSRRRSRSSGWAFNRRHRRGAASSSKVSRTS